nr:hypothetical protein [Tanacetum cinerariifolium]
MSDASFAVPYTSHPPSPIEIPYVPEPEYPEYLEPSDDEAPLEDQPPPVNALPIAASPDYEADSDLEEDLEEDPEDDQADYLADRGDGDDEPSDDDDTDDEDPEEESFEDKEDEDHPAPADSPAIPIVDLALPVGDTEAIEADEPTHAPGSPIIIPLSQTRLRKARKIVRPEPPMSVSMEACIARHVALPSPPLLVPSIPLPLPSPLTTSLTDTGAPLGYRVAEIRMRALLPSTSRRTDIHEADMPRRKKACLTTLAPRFEIRESSTAGAARQPGPTESDLRRYKVEQAGYGITDTWDEIVDTLIEIASTTLEGVNERVTQLDTTIRQRTDKFEIRFEEAQDDRALLRARVNTLFRDRPDHRRTVMLMDREAMYAQNGTQKRTTRATPTTTTTPTTTITNAQLQALIDRGVAAALAECDANRSRNGTKGVIGLNRWLENMESVFQISNYTVACQVKFASCTLKGSALTWWNSHMRAVGQDVAYAMPWAALKRMITDKYCPRESAKVERYIGGLLDMIHGSVKASKPQSMQEAIKFSTEMMDKKMPTHIERQAEHKRDFDDISRNNQHQQQPFKRDNVARAYTAGPGDKKPYGGTKHLCPKCNYHHDRPCAPKCTNCKKIGHLARDCKGQPTAAANNNNNNQRAQGANARGTAGTNPNSNIVMGTFLLNNHYASILFDIGADRSFISTAFSSLIVIIPTTLDHGYDVELADEMGSFDVIIGMDWLVKYHAVIVCDKKLVRVPFDGKILIFHGEGSNNGHESRLNIISCTKIQ